MSARQSVNDVTKLDAAFTKYVYDQQLYGAALGVLHKGKLIYGDGRGFVRGDDAAAGTLMPVLGLSKLLTAVAVLRLADHGKLRLDDKVSVQLAFPWSTKQPSGVFLIVAVPIITSL